MNVTLGLFAAVHLSANVAWKRSLGGRKPAQTAILAPVSLVLMDSGFVGSTTAGYSAALSHLDTDQHRTVRTISDLRDGPIPAVLDTSCVRTGLHYQLVNGRLPTSVDIVRSGRIRMFMELDTLHETWERLPKFAGQMDVPVATLQRMFANEWLPMLSVVSIPEALRRIDERAGSVRDLDPDDYPTAALATLLSPCILPSGPDDPSRFARTSHSPTSR